MLESQTNDPALLIFLVLNNRQHDVSDGVTSTSFQCKFKHFASFDNSAKTKLKNKKIIDYFQYG